MIWPSETKVNTVTDFSDLFFQMNPFEKVFLIELWCSPRKSTLFSSKFCSSFSFVDLVIVAMFVWKTNLNFAISNNLIAIESVIKNFYVIDRIKRWKSDSVSKVKTCIERFENRWKHFLACRKLQCLMVNKSNRTYCECAHRNVPCDSRFESQDDVHCYERENRLRSAAIALPRQEKIDCSKIICKGNANKTSVCPSDSEWIVDNNISSVCCQSSEFCSCLSCPKTICNENSILQIYRTGDGLTPGLCCDQYHCTTSKSIFFTFKC